MTVSSKPTNPVLVELYRGSQVESFYRGCAAVVDSQGEVKLAIGNVDELIYPRSSIKIVQALALVESGAADAFGLSDAELAVTCASHSGEPLHVGLVRSILQKAGLDESALECGCHWPMGRESERSLAREGGEPSPLHNNCSGKHAGMLATCVHLGWPVDSYTHGDHPLQVQIAQCLGALSGDEVDPSVYGVDGCSLPNWQITSTGLARVFARVVTGDGLEETRAAAFKRLVQAGFGAPDAMAGTGRFCTKILKALPNQVYVKEGAEGVYCAALLEQGLGIAVKIDDGARRPSEIVIASIIGALIEADGDGVLNDYKSAILRTWMGVEVGQVVPSATFRELLTGC